ncbi:MAG: aminotransferase class IV family protein, partial [Deltaproteobacteria bacterium]|nr:aminotransferase class IV family protein [Deltaproteobacteria bacterium]
GNVFAYVDEHMERLQKSAKLCQMDLAQSPEFLMQELTRTFVKYREIFPQFASKDTYCRIVISRGVGNIGFGLPCIISGSHYYLILQPLNPPTPEQYQCGFHLKISTRLRNHPKALDPAMKSGNYLNNILAYLEATKENYDDALLCNTDEHITEGTTFNIFYVRHGTLATPPLDIGILAGITRTKTIQIAKNLNLPVIEARFPKERLYEADEVFITSTIKEIFPITRIDNRTIGTGKPGPITKTLSRAYTEQTKFDISYRI